MDTLFQNILTASFHGSIVIVAVLILRFFLKKTPKKFLCLLWLLAGLRLLMPFEIQSELSLQPQPEPIVQQMVAQEILPLPQQAAPAPLPIPTVPVQEAVHTLPPLVVEEVVAPAETVTIQETKEMDWMGLIPWIWAAVASLFLVYTIVSYVSLRLTVRDAIKIPGGWESDRIETAFILGFIKPKIYIPMGLSKMVRKHILAHERTHLEKGDHWFKMVGFIALALHWFNPLVWIAYLLLCKDIEMACDERVVQFMELQERKEYSAALLNCSTNKAHFTACPVAFGEVSVKYRIKSVLKYKKPSFWISLAGVIAIIFVAVCLVTSPTETEEAANTDPSATTTVEEGEILVTNVDEFLAAIAPDTTIVLAPGTYNLSAAADYGTKNDDYYSWVQIADGYELALHDIANLTIRGSGRLTTTLETDPRFAQVLAFNNCSNLTLEGFTAGHTIARGECSGGVVFLQDCRDVSLSGLGLFGCGTVGLISESCTHVTVTDSDIYDCSSAAFQLNNTNAMTISGCRIYRIGIEGYGGYTFLEANASQDLTVENNEFTDSSLYSLMSLTNSSVTVKGNLFRDDRPQNCAFFVGGGNVILDENRFEGCAIRSWFAAYSDAVYDADWNVLTEEALNQKYFPEQASAETPQQLSVHVSTVDEFLAAIGPNREIILDQTLYDFSTATGYGSTYGEYYYWEDVYDGPGLVIQNVENLTIRGGTGKIKGHNLTAVPRYADVLQFKACKNITLKDFTAGHTIEPGSCAGNVLEFKDSDSITIENCGLFGCGVIGVKAEYCSDIQVRGCDIYECSFQGIQIRESRKINIEGNTFRDLGDANISLSACEDAIIDGQVIMPPNEISSYVQKNTEQKDRMLLEETLRCFSNGYFNNDIGMMQEYISKNYQGELTGYPVPEKDMFSLYFEVTLEQWEEADKANRYSFPIRFRESQGDWETQPIYNMTLNVIREDGSWKVVSYALDDQEKQQLEEALNVFATGYLYKDITMMQAFASESFLGTLEVGSYSEDQVVLERYAISAEDWEKADKSGEYAFYIPFKQTPESYTTTFLVLHTVREEGNWAVTSISLMQ